MLYRIAEIEAILSEAPGLYVRTSEGYAADLEHGETDPVTGRELSGLAAYPLDPPATWPGTRRDWLARQLRPHRGVEGVDREQFSWILRGRVVGHSAQGDPLIADIEVVARLADCLLDEAEQLSRERERVGGEADRIGGEADRVGIDSAAHV